jgi:ubiquinone/menaquinone biosynthesis C-methylase UbiE
MTAAAPARDAREIARNIAVHDRIARKYDKLHGEIFNPVEQSRLHRLLGAAMSEVRTGQSRITALDVGCGSGNLTRHMLELGMAVTAADVSSGFLDLVRSRYPTDALETLLMNGQDLRGVADGAFDFVATYSVLHHIPDYLGAVGEMARVCKAGGVVLLDHEPADHFWTGSAAYQAFRKEASRVDWRKYLRPSNYVHKVRRLIDPRHTNEGDIHVWPDDHVEWPRIKELMAARGFEIVIEEDYLLYRNIYRKEVFDLYAGRCTDMKAIVFRKQSAGSGV